MSIMTPPNTKKILFAKTDKEDEIKKQKAHYCKEYNNQIKINNLTHNEKFNAYLFNINKEFLIIDIDTEHAFDYINELIIKHNLKADEFKITKSISNINKINKFKHHIYFKNNLNIEKDYLLNGLDLLTNKLLFEDAKQFNKKINLDELPELTQDFYNDLIKYNCSSKEPQQQENNNDEIEIKEAEEQFKNYNKTVYDEIDYNEFQDKEKIKELLYY